MCLAVPGKVIDIARDTDNPVTGVIATVDFQGNRLDVSLVMTPEAAVGDWVLVHAGYAMTILDEQSARETWEYLELGQLGEMPDELRGAPADTAEGD